MYSKVTSNVRVSVIPEYDAKNSYPAADRYIFKYHIFIENLGHDAVKLLHRNWLIYDVGFGYTEVDGPGVIGLLPEIDKDGDFSYFSNVMLRSGIGHMQGTYTFENLSDGSTFVVDIPKFELHSLVLAN